tara:strand:- start:1322 stop:1612 length:291 start_codon:yes stop_codon:yes gene_type:complete
MYARVAQISLGPGQREFAEARADVFVPIITALKGHKSTTFMFDIEAGEFTTLSIWDTKENAVAATEELAPWLREAVGDKLKRPISVDILEVYEPKT